MAAVAQPNVAPTRLRAMVVPREHGAWGLLLVPLVTGAAVGTRDFRAAGMVALLTLAALSLFWLRTPVECLLGAGPLRAHGEVETRAVINAISLLATSAVASLGALFLAGAGLGLVILGSAAAGAFVVQAALKKLGRRYYMPAQIVGALGLTATAPAAYYASTGRLDGTAAALWLANWLFAGNQVHFVQLRIHAARISGARAKLNRGAMFFAGQLAMAIALVAGWRMDWLPALAALAFLPALVRGFAWFVRGPQPLAVKRLGWTEMAHAVAFGLLLITGFLL